MADDQAHAITLFVNNQRFKTTEQELAGAQIKSLAGIPSDYELFHVEGTNSLPVGDAQRVRLHSGEHFRAIPSGTFGNNGYPSTTR
jgi:hypothetical protein